MSSLRDKILNFVNERNRVITKEVADELGIPLRKAYLHLNSLAADGKIVKYKHGKRSILWCKKS